MRFDLISIFPGYFDALDQSLLGKARQGGLLEVVVSDLRHWAEGKHRSVDDTPAGGGAGMVMRPDVWGRAIDATLDAGNGSVSRQVLAIPTPSGTPLTQRHIEGLVSADQIVVACGRYEGPDARVAKHFRQQDVEVFEYSLGDYVLNGGEVAAIVLVEAVGRLLDGVVGNPQSLVEESHNLEGLLEYPAYTQPRQWRGLETPPVLLSGDHARISRWRRDQSLARTAAIRPDLIPALDPADLNGDDLCALALGGWLLTPEPNPVEFRVPTPTEAAAVSALAATTFPDACPDFITEPDQASFITEFLSPAAFAAYLEDPDYLVIVAQVGDVIAAYALVARRIPEPMGKAPEDAAYLSKCYTAAEYRGSGLSAALVEWTVSQVAELWGCGSIALATNAQNRRAAKFYRRAGFKKAGRRVFMVGEAKNIDDVFVRAIGG